MSTITEQQCKHFCTFLQVFGRQANHFYCRSHEFAQTPPIGSLT
jgi:hypothetical protein